MKKLHILSMVALIMLVGCASSQTQNTQPSPTTAYAADAPTTNVHINAFSFGFTQDPVTIHKGDHVHLVVTSSSGTHGVMIPGLGVSTGAVSPGEQQVVDFVASDAGTFDYFCNVPCGSGHRSMKGQLVIEP